MDLKNLLSTTNDVPISEVNNKSEQKKPGLVKRPSTISFIVNQEDQSHEIHGSSSPAQIHMESPILNKPISSAYSSPTLQKIGPSAQTIRARSSISSLTNDNDVDLNGNETPNSARRQSTEIINSESNSPIVPKKTITKKPSVLDLVNTDTNYEENTDKAGEVKVKKVNSPKIQTQQQTKRNSSNIPKLSSENQKTSNGKPKPKRYSEPPVWARRWIPPSKQEQQQQLQHHHRQPKASEPHRSIDHSLTGIKPYNDITRKITTWVWSHIHNVTKEDRRFLELEVKFGKIWDKAEDRRINLPVTNECIISDDFMLRCSFKPGLDKEYFDKAQNYIGGLSKLHKEKFKTLKTRQVDKIFREATRNEIPRQYRLTFDYATKRLDANIEKRKIGSLHIYSPDLLFDYRLTMSLELESRDNPERFENKTPEITREKKRTSITNDSTATRFDLTEVIQRGKNSKSTSETKSELELETDIFKLLDAFDRLEHDNITFEELNEVLLDNARILNREVSRSK